MPAALVHSPSVGFVLGYRHLHSFSCLSTFWVLRSPLPFSPTATIFSKNVPILGCLTVHCAFLCTEVKFPHESSD